MHPIITSILLGLDRRRRQRLWRRDYCSAPLGAALSSLLRRARRGIHAGYRDAGDGSRESGATGKTAAFLILLGYLIIHFFEHTVTPHFHFGEETHHDEFVHSHTGYSVLFGLIIHTFFDGIAIASGFLVSNWLGWIIFLAIFLHKIPEGFTVSSVMLASGRSRGTAWGAPSSWVVRLWRACLTMAIFRHHVGAACRLRQESPSTLPLLTWFPR